MSHLTRRESARILRTRRYPLTAEGLGIALACHRTQACVLGPVLLPATLDGESTTRLQAPVAAQDREVGQFGGRTRTGRVVRKWNCRVTGLTGRSQT